MPMEERVRSRLLEYNLTTSEAPTSVFLNTYFPNLYQQPKTNKVKLLSSSKFSGCVFNVEGYHNLHVDKEITRTKILEASVAIRKYCQDHSKSLRWLLAEFLDFVKKCNVQESVNNMMMFIMKKLLKDEILMKINMANNFNFLDIFATPTPNSENSAVDPKQDQDGISAIKRPIKIKKKQVQTNEDSTKIKEETKEEMKEDMKENIKGEMKGEIKEEMKDMKESIKEEMKEDMKEEMNVVVGDMKEETTEEIIDGNEETIDGNEELLECHSKHYKFKNFISWKIADDHNNNNYKIPKCETWIESFIFYSYLK